MEERNHPVYLNLSHGDCFRIRRVVWADSDHAVGEFIAVALKSYRLQIEYGEVCSSRHVHSVTKGSVERIRIQKSLTMSGN